MRHEVQLRALVENVAIAFCPQEPLKALAAKHGFTLHGAARRNTGRHGTALHGVTPRCVFKCGFKI